MVPREGWAWSLDGEEDAERRDDEDVAPKEEDEDEEIR